MNRATKEFEYSVVNIVSPNSSAAVWYDNRLPKCKSFTCLYNRLLFIHVTSAVLATVWLTALDGTQPTVFDNDIDMMNCFTDSSAIFTWWSHANIHIAKSRRYVDYTKFTNRQNFILKKKQIWRDFS